MSPVASPSKKQRLDVANVEASTPTTKSVTATKKTEIKPPFAKADPGPEPKPVPITAQRRNSFQKQKEQWVVSDRIKTPSPTPPVSANFVAKKSRPAETISFSLPAGGFNGKKAQSKSKPLNMHVDELFNQYFPSQNEEHELETEVSSKPKNRTTKVDQYSIGKQPKHCVEQILDNILSNVLYCSMKRKATRRRELENEDSTDDLINNCDILISTEDLHHPNSGKRKRRRTENLGNYF